jgi:sRNA-binding regulator protein Hfq
MELIRITVCVFLAVGITLFAQVKQDEDHTIVVRLDPKQFDVLCQLVVAQSYLAEKQRWTANSDQVQFGLKQAIEITERAKGMKK